MKRTSETAFETAIEGVLLSQGYYRQEVGGFDRDRLIFPEAVIGFIQETQGSVWAKLEALCKCVLVQRESEFSGSR